MADDAVPGVAPTWSGAPAGSDDVARLVRATLDPVLVDRGFAPGQEGVDATGVGVVYCTPHRHARRRFPALVDPLDPGSGVTAEHACTDVNVDVAVGSVARLVRVDLEGVDLADLLTRAGRADLRPQADVLATLPLPDALTALAALLGTVLDAGDLDPGVTRS